jgi:hypothetical protein
MDLSGARAKLERAKEHLQLLDETVRDVRLASGGDSSLVLGGFYRSVSESFELRVISMPQYPLTRWGTVLGDYVQNLRSALDHAAYQLVASGSEPSDAALGRSQFPICDTHDLFDSEVPRRLSGVAPRAISVVKEAQPFEYHNIDISPTRILRELSNRDKHRLLIPLLLAPDDLPASSVQVHGAEVAAVTTAPHVPLTEGSTVAEVWLQQVRATHVPTISIKELPIYMSLGEPAGYASLWLDAMRGRVERVLDHLDAL